MSEPLHVVPKAAPTPVDGREEVVRLLEDLLAQATAGLLTAVAIVGLRPNTTVVTTSWATGRGVDVFRLLGAVAHLTWRLGEWADGAKDVPLPEFPRDA